MKLVLRIFLVLFSVIALILASVVTVWIKPELVLTDTRVQSLFDSLAGEYFSQKPKTLKLQLLPYGFTGKHIVIEVGDFCMKEPEACFKQVHAEFSVKIGGFTRVKLYEVGPIAVLNEKFNYTVQDKPKTAEPKEKSGSVFDHLSISDHLSVKDFVVDFPKIRVENKKEIILASAGLDGKQLEQITVKLNADSNQNLTVKLAAKTAFALGKESPFSASLEFKDHVKIKGDLQGQVNWQILEGSLGGQLDVNQVMPWINTISLKNLKLERHHHHSKINADIETKLDQTLAANHSQSVMPNVRLDTLIRGKLDASENNGSIAYEVDLGPSEDKGASIAALVGGKVPFPKGEEYRYGIDRMFLKFEIPVFQTLVKNLRLTNYAVPAPFSALKGSVKLLVNQDAGKIENDRIPVSLNTHLDSSEQIFKTQSDASIQFAQNSEKIKIDGTTRIEAFTLTLPDLKVLEPAPMVKNDSRLMAKGDIKILKTPPALTRATPTPEEKDEPSKIDFNWKISTAASGIKIFHPVLKPYAPAEVTWEIGNQNAGSIDLKPFDIEYLNRSARIHTLRIYQTAGDHTLHYTGRLIIKKTDYTIFVDIIQDGEKPKVVLSSSPPLENGDIVSVLLFNQTSDQLDSSDENSSVGNTQSAIANRALGLFSILALSSTPIEAVNYNPGTGVYSARVKLANGLTATVGTDWDKSQEVALRKRLGRNFVLSTILQTDPDTNTETRKTLIEWFKRF